jgi:hypothetical protein
MADQLWSTFVRNVRGIALKDLIHFIANFSGQLHEFIVVEVIHLVAQHNDGYAWKLVAIEHSRTSR